MELNAIRNLYNKDCTKDGDVVLIEGVTPTSTEWTAIKIEVARIQAEYDAKQYQRLRASAYPSITDQLDTIYHEGIDAWKAVITAVKEEYPKP
jgi:predicted lipoprotein